MSQAAKKKDDRIDLRVDDSAKQLIERAASIAGMSVSSYTLSNTLRAAREEIGLERLHRPGRLRDLAELGRRAPRRRARRAHPRRVHPRVIAKNRGEEKGNEDK